MSASHLIGNCSHISHGCYVIDCRIGQLELSIIRRSVDGGEERWGLGVEETVIAMILRYGFFERGRAAS